MKNSIILIATLSFLSISALSQKNPPDNVKKEFVKKYSSAQGVKWESEGKTEWEAEFKMDNKKMSASFDNYGKWLESETGITEKELPASVEMTLNNDFAGFKKGHIEIFESPEMNGFEIGLKKGETSLEVIFDNKGNILKKTIVRDEDEKSEKVGK